MTGGAGDTAQDTRRSEQGKDKAGTDVTENGERTGTAITNRCCLSHLTITSSQ